MALKSVVDIEVIKKAGVNIPIKSYATQPFKVLNITEDPAEGVVRLMLMSASPGVLNNDHYDIKITLGASASLELKTQSFQRLFNMKDDASQDIVVQLQQGAFFKYLPHPVVPHEFSNFRSTTSIFLSQGCKLILGEVFTCGRKLNGEAFLFTKFQSLTEIFLAGRLMIKENLFMEPASTSAFGLGQLEGYTHQATMFFLDPAAEVKKLTSIASACLESQPGLIYGVTAAPVTGIVIRLLGNKAEQMFQCLQHISLDLQAITTTIKS